MIGYYIEPTLLSTVPAMFAGILISHVVKEWGDIPVIDRALGIVSAIASLGVIVIIFWNP